jgi:hypothetical protein
MYIVRLLFEKTRFQDGLEFSPFAILFLLFVAASLIVAAFKFLGSVFASIFNFLSSPVFLVMVVLGFIALLAVSSQ